MARYAKRAAIVYRKSQFRKQREWFDVVDVYSPASLATKLAGVVVSFYASVPPEFVFD